MLRHAAKAGAEFILCRRRRPAGCSSRSIKDGYKFVLGADTRGYFSTINHQQLLEAVGRRVSARWMLKRLREWWQAGVTADDGV